MKTLYESLLDDFDTLASNQDKVFERPFVTLWNTANGGNNWDVAIQTFEDVISAEGEWTKSLPKGLAKDEVFVAFYYEQFQPDVARLYIRFNKTTFQPFKKSQGRSIAGGAVYKEPAITVLGRKWNGMPTLNVIAAHVDHNLIKGGYILSERHAQDALRMLQLMSEHKWNKQYW